MAYLALRPIKFDKAYLPGDHIDEDKVFSSVAQDLISAGYISHIPEAAKEPKDKKVEKKEAVTEEKDKAKEAAAEEEPGEEEGPKLEFTRDNLLNLSKAELHRLLDINKVEYSNKDTKEILVDKFLQANI